MSMITTTSAAASSDPAGVLIFLAALGAAAVCFGARWTFNLRGAVDATLARRRAALELKGQRTGDLSLADTESLGPGFFKLIGSVIAVAGLALLALSLILATH
ncbi:hypothetical protein [Streptomyces sp. NPDC003247]|uniref:hypothetical protein n=1 Tax=Streptomyces sp. NPDC003247 TaxID=3364677 RepID=UPI003681A3F6